MPSGIPKNGINKGWFKKGHIPSNKGDKHTEETRRKMRIAWSKTTVRIRNPNSIFRKGHKLNVGRKLGFVPEHAFKKGMTPWNKNKKGVQICSKETRIKISKGNKGKIISEEQIKKFKISVKKHWDKVGRKKHRKHHHSGTKYDKWRKTIFEYDDYTCWLCGRKGCKLNAHHLYSWAQYPRLRYKLSNGITLCEECHKIYDRNYAKRIHKKSQCG